VCICVHLWLILFLTICNDFNFAAVGR
jgi:hypothetical protein